jgi:hypothetical protein
VSDNDDGPARPRHRKKGPARKRSGGLPGRHLRAVTAEPAGSVPPGAYPVADLTAMSPGAADLLLHRARLDAEAGAGTWPHLVVTTDVETGAATRRGPYATGLEALTVATEFAGKYRNLEPHWNFTLAVVPLPAE